VEARLATDVVKRLVEAGSAGQGDIGVITPYEAQTSLIKSMLRSECLSDVEAANIDGFQGREHEVIVVSLARSNSDGKLGHVDDGRRLNVARTRAKRALIVIGDRETLKYGYESGLSSFMRDVYQRGVVIEMPPDPRRAANLLKEDPQKVVMDPTEAKAAAMTMSDSQPIASSTTERKHKILQTVQ
jgi:superfamily I DNA and/or RNA helicase